MSAFGKYGVGGKVPGKYTPGPDEQLLDFDAAAQGTDQGNPDSMPEVKPTEGSHVATQ